MTSKSPYPVQTMHMPQQPSVPLPSIREKRIFLAVDAANHYYALPYGKRIQFDVLLDYANKLGTCVQSAIYISKDAESNRENGLLAALRFMGYTRIVPRAHHILANGKKKSDVDVYLALDVWKSALKQEMDVLVLASGDVDFTPLVERLISETGIEVHVIGPDMATSSDLMIAANQFHNASQVPGLVQDRPWLTQTVEHAQQMAT